MAQARVEILVLDAEGKPLADAAVYAELPDASPSARKGTRAQIEQRGRKFLPLVTVVQIGTDVSFPNNDRVRHNVYSFSPAKTFDLKLFSGDSSPITFDKAGTIAVGCNIHDQMAAYIHVVPTPYFGKSDSSGVVRLADVPQGSYRLKAWHYRMPQGAVIPEQAIKVGSSEVRAEFKLSVKPEIAQ